MVDVRTASFARLRQIEMDMRIETARTLRGVALILVPTGALIFAAGAIFAAWLG